MNVEEFRDFCLSFPDTREGMPFEGFFKNSKSILVFYVGKKMFCLFDLDKFDRCTLKCDPKLIDELRDQKGIDKPFNLSPKHWISVELNGDVSWEFIKELIAKSYQLVTYGLQKINNQVFINFITQIGSNQYIKIILFSLCRLMKVGI